MKDLFEEGDALEYYNGPFPVHMVFHDVENDTVKEMEVTEEAWNDTLKTFEDNDNVSRNVIYKYMSKHDTVTPTPYFKNE